MPNINKNYFTNFGSFLVDERFLFQLSETSNRFSFWKAPICLEMVGAGANKCVEALFESFTIFMN